MGLRQNVYNALVRKDVNVQREYERYVMEHTIEHYESRFTHWKILWKLNWHYRVMKSTVPLLYFDQILNTETKDGANKDPVEESNEFKRTYAHHIASDYLRYEIVSFSVFDTLLLSPFSDPTDLFLLLEEELNQNGFREIRIQCEQAVRNKALSERGNQEVTIQDIWEELERMTGICAQEGIKKEFDLEKKLCFANPYFKRVWEILRSHNQTIYVLADTYFPQDMVKELLELHGFHGASEILVSCEYNCNKNSDGDLFKILLQRTGNRPLIHVGSNYGGDVIMAERFEVDTHYYKGVNAIGNKFRVKDMSKLIGSGYAGIVNAKLYCGLKRYDGYYEHGYIYGGIYVLGFANYIAQYCKTYHIEKVLFLSDHGEIYSKVFEMICKTIPWERFYWSATATEILTAGKDRHSFIEKLVWNNIKNNIDITISDLFISAKLGKLLAYFGEYRLQPDEILHKGNGLIVQQLLQDHYEEILQNFETERKGLKSYLKNFLGESERVVLVDVTEDDKGIDKLASFITKDWRMCEEVKCMVAQSSIRNTHIAACYDEEALVQTYLFHRYDDCLFKIFTRSTASNLNYVNEKEAFVFSGAEVENHQMIKQIQKGIIDFARDYINVFGNYRIMMNISGYDACMPMKKIFGNSEYFRHYFSEFIFESAIFPDPQGSTIQKLNNIMMHKNM